MSADGYDWGRVLARAPEGLSVSAIVVSYRTGPVLFDCLHALLADPDIAEVVVVDNGNSADVLARLDALAAGGRLKVVGEGVNRGFAEGVNLGAKTATGERLLIINPDAVLRRGSIAALEAALGAEPAIVGGRIFGADGVEQRGCRRRKLTLASAAGTFLGLSRAPVLGRWLVDINRSGEPPPDGAVAMEAVSGALMYLTREGFGYLSGFDEGYFLHVEDLDICRRAEMEGGSVMYAPDAGAYHYGATSDVAGVVVERHKAAGLKRYFAKFASSPVERTIAGVLAPLITAALGARAKWRERQGE